MIEQFDLDPDFDHEIQPQYNICPNESAWVINSDRKLSRMAWGVNFKTPYKTNPNFVINSRQEDLLERQYFKDAFFKYERCLIPADSFYEFEKTPGKTAYRFIPTNGLGWLFAGLKLTDQTNNIKKFVILTTEANQVVAKVHDRMPVIIDPSNMSKWFQANHYRPNNPNLLPIDNHLINTMTVDPIVRKVSSKGPQCHQSFIPKDYFDWLL